MNKYKNKSLTPNSQLLRKNMTKEERHLWYDFLKPLPYSFRRQKVIGKYIVDFYCSEKKIVIELDGAQHYYEENMERDRERDEYIDGLGLKVLRYTNLDIKMNFEGVCEDITRNLDEK